MGESICQDGLKSSETTKTLKNSSGPLLNYNSCAVFSASTNMVPKYVISRNVCSGM